MEVAQASARQGFVDLLLRVKCCPAGLGKAPGAGKASRPQGGREGSQPWLPMGSSRVQSIPDSRRQPLELCRRGSATSLGTGISAAQSVFCGCNSCIPWEPVTNAESQAPPRTTESETALQPEPQGCTFNLRSTFYSPGS